MTLFWNAVEQRTRALWRILACLLLTVVAVLAATSALGEMFGSTMAGIVGPLVGITAGVWLAGRLLDLRGLDEFGLSLDRNWWMDFTFGAVLGVALMAMIFGVEYGAGWISITDTNVTSDTEVSFAVALLIGLLGFISVGFYEELLFRGYLLRNIAEGLHFKANRPAVAIIIAWVFTSAFFGVAHAGNPNATLISSLNISLAGILLGIGYVCSGKLAIPIGLHITWNFAQGNLFGFPVSGTTGFSAQVFQIEQGGPDLWTGGAFGPEAGLIGLVAMGLGLFATWAYLRMRYGRVRFDESLVHPPEVTTHSDAAP